MVWWFGSNRPFHSNGRIICFRDVMTLKRFMAFMRGIHRLPVDSPHKVPVIHIFGASFSSTYAGWTNKMLGRWYRTHILKLNIVVLTDWKTDGCQLDRPPRIQLRYFMKYQMCRPLLFNMRRHNMETFSELFTSLWGVSTGHCWFPSQRASITELWCFIWCTPEQTVEQTVEYGELRRHRRPYHVTVMVLAAWDHIVTQTYEHIKNISSRSF